MKPSLSYIMDLFSIKLFEWLSWRYRDCTAASIVRELRLAYDTSMDHAGTLGSIEKGQIQALKDRALWVIPQCWWIGRLLESFCKTEQLSTKWYWRMIERFGISDIIWWSYDCLKFIAMYKNSMFWCKTHRPLIFLDSGLFNSVTLHTEIHRGSRIHYFVLLCD